MSIRKILIKFNRRQEAESNHEIPQPSTNSQDTMRTRSGFEYVIESSDLLDEETLLPTPAPTPTPIPTPSASNMFQPLQLYQPIQDVVPVIDLTVQPSNQLGTLNNNGTFKKLSIRLLKMCGNCVLKIVNLMPTILTSIAGAHALVQLIHPPEQRIEVYVSTKWLCS